MSKKQKYILLFNVLSNSFVTSDRKNSPNSIIYLFCQFLLHKLSACIFNLHIEKCCSFHWSDTSHFIVLISMQVLLQDGPVQSARYIKNVKWKCVFCRCPLLWHLLGQAVEKLLFEYFSWTFYMLSLVFVKFIFCKYTVIHLKLQNTMYLHFLACSGPDHIVFVTQVTQGFK